MQRHDRKRPRLPALAAVLIAAAAVIIGFGASPATASTNPGQADGPGIITIEQTNMCMWGSTFTKDCFPNSNTPGSTGWEYAEAAIAGDKRTALSAQITRHDPDVLTVNEGCLNDVTAVASARGYQVKYVYTGRNTHPCTVGRGQSVNAILTKGSFIGTVQSGYFSGVTENNKAVLSYRSYICASVRTDQWSNVRVCTAHLSLKSQPGTLKSTDPYYDVLHKHECGQLDSILANSTGYVIFAGDVNSGTYNCAPSTFHGLKDVAVNPADKIPTSGLQHIYYSANGFWRQSCGWAYTVEHTDHKGFLLELGKKPPSSLGDCPRGI